jgi:cytochrome b involved in lipid metabolism
MAETTAVQPAAAPPPRRFGTLYAAAQPRAQHAAMQPQPRAAMAASSSSPTYTLAELAKHNTRDDLWIAVDGGVYDFSAPKGAIFHPGGLPPLLELAGTECTEAFYGLHRAEVLMRPQFAKLRIGSLEGRGEGEADTAASSSADVPYAESMGFWRRSSPYYSEEHEAFRQAVRDIYEREVAPSAEKWDEEGTPASPELFQALGDAGLVATLVAGEERGAKYLERWGVQLPGGVQPRHFDYFHGLIAGEESIRGVRGGYGLKDGLIGGVSIGVVPIIKYHLRDISMAAEILD